MATSAGFSWIWQVSLPRMRTWLLSFLLLCSACGKSGAPDARKSILHEDAPRVETVALDIMARHSAGLVHAADRIGAGFVKADPAQQEAEMRQVLKLIRSPKRGVPELVISPMSFLAVVGKDGKAIARDIEPDKMKGMDLGKMFPVVQDALNGKAGHAVGEFQSEEEGGKPSITVLMAAPAHYKGEVVGALVLGIPLWRLQQVLTKQLQMELGGKESVVIWVYVYRGSELHHHGTPPDLDKIVPDDASRKAGLAKSPGGFTGEVQQYAYWYGYGVRPLRIFGPDIGVILVRMQQ
jgi:hypothetical protein